MLRTCSEAEFERYLEFAYALATDLTRSGYPTYCDGVKTKAMFAARSRQAFRLDTEQLLLFESEGTIEGVIHCEWIPEDRYLSTVCFSIRRGTEQALSEFLEYARTRFPGYDLFLGFPAEHRVAVRFLAERGFACIEDDYNNTAFLDECRSLPTHSGLIPIGIENYELFQALHRPAEADMYWNSERILADLAHWNILVKEERGIPQGAVYYRAVSDGWFEIFGVDVAGNRWEPQLFQELLNGALLDAKRRGGRFMTFFCEREYEDAAVECGFQCIGNYLCYKIHLES